MYIKKKLKKLKIYFKNSILPLLAGSIGLSPFLSIKAENAPDVTWTKLLGTSSFAVGNGVATASDGSIFITGYTQGDLDGETNVNVGGYDAFLTKYGSDGTKAWTKLLGTSSLGIVYGVATASDGSIFITGYAEGDLDGETNAGSTDILVTKYSSDGTKVWTKLVGTTDSDVGQAITTSSDGSIYVTGYTMGDLDGETNAGEFDAFLMKLAEAVAASSTTLHTEWVQPYAAMQNIGLKSIHNNRDLVLAKAGECNNYGWVIGDTDYCVYTNAKNKVSYVNGDTTRGSYGSAVFNGSINVEKTINDKWKAGVAYGMGSANLYDFNFSGTTANLNSSNNHYSVYGVKKVSDKFTLKGMVGGSVFDYKGKRNYSTTAATSAYETDGYTAEINGTWDIKKEIKNSKTPIRLQPTVGVAFAAHAQDGFSESGSGDLITVESNQAESLVFKTGIGIDKQITMQQGWLLVPSLALNYEMDTYAGRSNRDIKGKVTGSSDASTSVEAKTFGQHRGSVKVGADFVMNKDFMFNLNAEYGLGTYGDDNSYGGGFRWQF